jgi:hypothetical protein
MAQQQLRMPIILLLAIGVVLVFRSVLRADAIAFGINLVGRAGIICLIVGRILAERLRRQINTPA